MTQKMGVLRIMIAKNDPKRWFYPYEVIQDEGLFIGYKAPARFCELCIDFPEMLDSQMEGKYRIARFRFDNSAEFLPKLPPDLREFVQAELVASGAGYETYRTVPVVNEADRSVKMTRIKEKVCR